MKKIVSIITIFLVLFLLTFSINVNAETLTSFNVQTTKQTIHPEETVTVNVEFGENLGSYTVEVAYDSNLFEYVSADGGTAHDTGTKVIVTYYDSTVGSNSRNSMSITFEAKDVTTSNPTEFNVTLKGLANADGSVTYDDITTPITKSVTVEPVYVDYTIALNYTGNIVINEEKDMEIVVSSTMGKSYEHTRIIAEAVTLSGETVKLLATDSQSLEHDIIQSGWGDDQGDSIGGKNVTKKIEARGIFSGAGDYSITLKLIDRDDSDAVIASKTFNISVGKTTVENNEVVPPTNEIENVQAPSTLPKTGSTIYFVVIPILAILVVMYVVLRKRD